MTLLIATPVYGQSVGLNYLQSIMEYQRDRIPFDHVIVTGTIITMARNWLVSSFYNNVKYDKLLFLDSDTYLPASGLKKLLSYKTDVVAAIVPRRGKGITNRGGCFPNISLERKLNKDGLVEVDWVGAAAVVISRKAVESLVQHCVDNGLVYDMSAKDADDETGSYNGYDFLGQYDIFKVGVKDGNYISEDVWMCQTLRSLGYKILVDPSISTKHTGSYTWQSPPKGFRLPTATSAGRSS